MSNGLSVDSVSSLVRSIEGLRNRRALFAMLSCMVAGVLFAGLFSLLASRLGFVMGFIGGLGLFVATATGIGAAGVLLMDQARNQPLRSFGEAVIFGMLCIPKFLALCAALLLVAAAVFIVLVLVYVVAKLPVLGPVLFVVVFPASVVVAGVTLCGLFLCMVLALPAIWEGSTLARALTQTLAIARSRLVEAILLMVVVGLLSMVVGAIVFGVLFVGLVPTIGMSASILGAHNLDSVFDVVRSGNLTDSSGGVPIGGAGYAVAAGIGAGLLWALAGSLVSLVYLLGLNIVYLRVTEGIDVDATQAAVKARLDEARRQAEALRTRARNAADRAREKARQSGAAVGAATRAASSPVPAPDSGDSTSASTQFPPTQFEPPSDATVPFFTRPSACPQCLSAVGRDDMFCGVCGHKLK